MILKGSKATLKVSGQVIGEFYADVLHGVETLAQYELEEGSTNLSWCSCCGLESRENCIFIGLEDE